MKFCRAKFHPERQQGCIYAARDYLFFGLIAQSRIQRIKMIRFGVPKAALKKRNFGIGYKVFAMSIANKKTWAHSAVG